MAFLPKSQITITKTCECGFPIFLISQLSKISAKPSFVYTNTVEFKILRYVVVCISTTLSFLHLIAVDIAMVGCVIVGFGKVWY